jgi:opacity protein-like surface antigen
MTILKQIFKQAFQPLATTALLIVQANADENLWLYARGVDTRPKDTWELKLKDVARLDKGSGDYAFNDFRPEIEYGITDKLTIGAALFIFDHHYSVDDPDLNPMYDTQGGVGGKFDDTQYGGFELGLKYNILSPYKDPIGLSVGFNYEQREVYRLDGSEIDQDSFVPILYIQKNFWDDTLITAFTGKVELERRKSSGVLEEEIALDLALGVAYRFAPKWFVGFEGRYQSDFLNPQLADKKGNSGFDTQGFEEGYDRSSFDLTDIRWGSQYQYGTYVGPSIHYTEKNWWVTGSILFQVKGGGSEGRNANIEGGKNYDEHERLHLGLTVGFNF